MVQNMDTPNKILTFKEKFLIMDIVFHKEIIDLEENYLINKVDKSLDGFTSGTLVDDSEVTITAKTFNRDRVNKYLTKEPLKISSPKLNYLITDSYHPLKGLSILSSYRTGRVDISGTNINNIYIDVVGVAIALYRSFNAPESINKKARDIRKRISDAEKQIPDGKKGIIHIGIETLEGDLTSRKRFDKIINTLSKFEVSENKEISFVISYNLNLRPMIYLISLRQQLTFHLEIYQ